MAITTLDSDKHSLLHGPWILACPYCNWTSLDIGIIFPKASNFVGQIARLKGQGVLQRAKSPSLDGVTKDQPPPADSEPSSESDATIFASLKSFYKSQLSASTPNNPLLTPGGELNYNSPSSLARLMSLYAGIGSYGKKSKAKSQEMRESANRAEGLRLIDPVADSDAVEKLRTRGWSGTTSIAQQAEQTQPTRFIDDLLPVPTLLRTKRSKRCSNCRHILIKPDAKIQNTRYRIKLVAVNYIPKFSLEALRSPQQPAVDLTSLVPHQATQFLLTVRNAIFDELHVTLATPTRTPGPYGHKVTILCPEFDVGPNFDIWDEALKENGRSDPRAQPNKSENPPGKEDSGQSGSESRVAEAGKVWEKGRHWTTVVLEVVCTGIGRNGEGDDDDDDEERKRGLEEDEDLLEIPIFVRLEWMGDVGVEETAPESIFSGGRTLTKRELAYWVVIGVGKVASGD